MVDPQSQQIINQDRANQKQNKAAFSPVIKKQKNRTRKTGKNWKIKISELNSIQISCSWPGFVFHCHE
jgi:hypothetical protein